MLLVIDVGNTQTVIGLYEADDGPPAADQGLFDHWRISTTRERTEDELQVTFANLLSLHDLTWHDIEGVAISSGVPPLTASLRTMSARLGFEAVVIEPGTKTGISILYDNPREVGADRIANAVGAFDLFGGPTVVVDFGTATTCDAVSANAEYLGGAIAPGIEVSLDALVGRASALSQVELKEPSSVLGKSTVESIQSGVMFGYASQVDGLCSRIQSEIGEANVVATGGLSALIAPLSASIDHVEPFLTLHGLRLVFEKNR